MYLSGWVLFIAQWLDVIWNFIWPLKVIVTSNAKCSCPKIKSSLQAQGNAVCDLRVWKLTNKLQITSHKSRGTVKNGQRFNSFLFIMATIDTYLTVFSEEELLEIQSGNKSILQTCLNLYLGWNSCCAFLPVVLLDDQ